jgi:hypothetical protein
MKVIDLKEAGIKRTASRSKYVARWLEISETEALSFDDYDDMRTAYYSINSFCRNNKTKYKAKQFSDQAADCYLVLKIRG